MTDQTLTQAELFDVFSNARRRLTVRFLRANGGTCDLAPLVEQVAAWENDTTTADVTRAQRRRVYISLYQTHLPMLEDHGIVDWDADGHTIDLLPSEGTFEPYLDRTVGSRRRWHQLYVGVAMIGAVAIGLSWLSFGPLTAGTAPLIAVSVSAAVLFIATVHRTTRTPPSLSLRNRF